MLRFGDLKIQAFGSLTLSRSTSVINIPNSEHIHASDKYILSFISVRSFAEQERVKFKINTISSSQGCFYPCNSKVVKIKLFFEFLFSKTISKFIPIHIIDIILLSVHLCTLFSVLKHITSMLCNLYSFQAMRICEMSKQGYFDVLSHSKPSPDGYCASLHVFCT